MKKTPILFVCAAMMLTGCSGATATIKDKDETIMTIGDTKYTKGDEYDLLKISTGTDLTMELVKQAIYKQEVKVTKEMKETYTILCPQMSPNKLTTTKKTWKTLMNKFNHWDIKTAHNI